MELPFRQICNLWLTNIKLALKHKKEVFQDDADEAMQFYREPHDFFWGGTNYERRPFEKDFKPSYRMTVNKIAEMVQLFGPVLYHRNPYRMVRPRPRYVPPSSFFVQPLPPTPPDPQTAQMLVMQFQQQQQMYQQVVQQEQQAADVDAARAELLELYLNYTPNEVDLKSNMRLCVDEALIKGRGVQWTEVWTPPGSQTKVIGSFYDNTDNLVLDPDHETLEHCGWAARRCVHESAEAERLYGLQPGSLSGRYESQKRQAEVSAGIYPNSEWARKNGTTKDLVVYWKIYSKIGFGARLAGGSKALREVFDRFGDFCYLVVADDVPYPLNLPPEALGQAQALAQAGDVQGADRQVLSRLDWPAPFWADGSWPFTCLDFHPVPGCVWPMSHAKPGMGYQKFLNWAYSFLAAKIKNTSRDFIAALKDASEDLKNKILYGEDLTLLEIDAQHRTISEVIQWLQHPEMNGDMWRVIEAVERAYERVTGVTEMMSTGQAPRAARSATETNLHREMLSIRPDDMAEKVEQFSQDLARKEAILARVALGHGDVQPVLGDLGASFWAQLVQSSDLNTVFRELEYTVQAGSTRKPNKDAEVQNTSEGAQVVMPTLAQWAQMTGDVSALNSFLEDWCKARGLDASRYKVPAPPPPPPPTSPGEEGSNEKSEPKQP